MNRNRYELMPPAITDTWQPPDVWDRWAHFDHLRRIQDRLGSLMIHTV